MRPSSQKNLRRKDGSGGPVDAKSSKHVSKSAVLLYLDPGYSALYTPCLGDTQVDLIDIRNKIEQLLPFDPGGPKQPTEALLVTLSQR